MTIRDAYITNLRERIENHEIALTLFDRVLADATPEQHAFFATRRAAIVTKLAELRKRLVHFAPSEAVTS